MTIRKIENMNLKTTIIDVTIDNIRDYPQITCFINPQHEFYHLKINWIKEQYEKGLKIKLLYLAGEKKPRGFLEYIPGENCWRSVNAKGYMFIHCLWITGKKYQHQGLGSLLIEEVEKDARDRLGVALIASDKDFMAKKNLFIKNGYKIIAESGEDQLLVKQFADGPLPSINNWEAELQKYDGLTIIYSKQCPWVARFIEEVRPILDKEELEIRFIELKSAAQAQKAPSLYGAFNFIYDGKLLADRYISTTRFMNIIKKELKK